MSNELEKRGFSVGKGSVERLLRDMGFSLQQNRKYTEARNPRPDRDGQFNFINDKSKEFLSRGLPVISVTTKKEELIGNYKNVGAEYRPQKSSLKVLDHDFPVPENGKASPYDVHFEVSEDKAAITIFAQKCPTYAIAWSDGGGTPVGPDTPDQPDIPHKPSWPAGSSSGGGSNVSTYAVTVEKTEHGKVTSNRINAASGTTVTLTATPDTGYVLNTLTVTDSRGNEIELTAKGDYQYTFAMPGRAVTVIAAFAPLPEDVEQPCDGGADCPSHGFTDLGTEGTWYHEAVDYVLRNGLMSGYGDGTFGPDDNLSRAMLAQILHNIEGRPVVNYLMQFTDVPGSEWYTEAVRWAASTGIITGYGDNLFGPDDNITREQLAVMLWRYAGTPAATNKELHFKDVDEAGDFALDTLRWAVENGILTGYGDGQLKPTGLATRTEVATMLMRYMEETKEMR